MLEGNKVPENDSRQLEESEDLVAVASLVRVRGIRGELLGLSLTTRPERLTSLGPVVLETEGRRRVVRVENVWFHDGRPVFKFAGIDSIEDAEPLKGADVLLPRIPPPEGEFAYSDLVGCAVIEDGVRTGEVIGIEEYGGPLLLKVRAENGRDMLVPFARSICREIDVAKREIRVVLPPGLSEL